MWSGFAPLFAALVRSRFSFHAAAAAVACSDSGLDSGFGAAGFAFFAAGFFFGVAGFAADFFGAAFFAFGFASVALAVAVA
jgi:hypothetical protein